MTKLQIYTNQLLLSVTGSVGIMYRNVYVQYHAKVTFPLCLTNQALRYEDVWGSGSTYSSLVGGE
jgi:hypothetical protein